MSVTVEDLKGAPKAAFLYCPDCGAQYSATHGDYSFWMAPDDVFTCNYEEHGPVPMRLVTSHVVIEDVPA